jgi:hypothetical protein
VGDAVPGGPAVGAADGAADPPHTNDGSERSAHCEDMLPPLRTHA